MLVAIPTASMRNRSEANARLATCLYESAFVVLGLCFEPGVSAAGGCLLPETPEKVFLMVEGVKLCIKHLLCTKRKPFVKLERKLRSSLEGRVFYRGYV